MRVWVSFCNIQLSLLNILPEVREEVVMYTQDLNAAFLYEAERRRDEIATARECCRVHQLLQDRPVKRYQALPQLLLNLLLLVVTLVRRH